MHPNTLYLSRKKTVKLFKNAENLSGRFFFWSEAISIEYFFRPFLLPWSPGLIIYSYIMSLVVFNTVRANISLVVSNEEANSLSQMKSM